MTSSISIVTVKSTMAFVPFWLPPEQEWHKTEMKNGNN